jgi:hypothetical protein
MSSISAGELLVLAVAMAANGFWLVTLIWCVIDNREGRVSSIWVVLVALLHIVGAAAFWVWHSRPRSIQDG